MRKPGKHSAPDHPGAKRELEKAGGHKAALFCLGVCFALLFTAALPLPLSQSNALNKQNSNLYRAATATKELRPDSTKLAPLRMEESRPGSIALATLRPASTELTAPRLDSTELSSLRPNAAELTALKPERTRLLPLMADITEPTALGARASARPEVKESPDPEQASRPEFKTLIQHVAPCWHPLLQRLQADGLFGEDVAQWFAGLPEPYSQKPMGVKVTALFKRRFMPPYFPYFSKPFKAATVYAGVVTKANIAKCREFLKANQELFQAAENKYHVPKEVLVSLLMVETRLGNFTGSEQALWSLACMASAEAPTHIESYLARLPVTEAHQQWLNDILKARSQWAYSELQALIRYCRLHEHDPLSITGSIYGAIGLCQFMPSNIPLYAVDGDGDGKIDLFALSDAVPSAANYLKIHGWRQNTSGKNRATMLKYYNHSTAYANTILGLADGMKTGKTGPSTVAGKAKSKKSRPKAASTVAAKKTRSKSKNSNRAKKS